MLNKTLFLKIILGLGISFVLGDLVFLNWQIFQEKKVVQKEKEEFPGFFLPTPTPAHWSVIEETTPSGQKAQTPSLTEENCPQACLLAIDQAKSIITPVPSTTAAPPPSSVKIFYLPLGSGSTKNIDWTDVPGLSSYIDPANYGKVKSVIFEASLRIPTANGKVYARLYNKNDGRPVWFSEISSEGTTSTLIQSQPITFEGGNKLYQVQAKTTMGFESFVDFARVKFIVE